MKNTIYICLIKTTMILLILMILNNIHVYNRLKSKNVKMKLHNVIKIVYAMKQCNLTGSHAPLFVPLMIKIKHNKKFQIKNAVNIVILKEI